MTDRRNSTPLRLALAAAALVALAGGALAPGHAEEPLAQTDPVLAAQFDAEFGEPLPRFEPAPLPEAEELFDAVPEPEESWEQLGTGSASWYGARFAGRPTASGERFDPAGYTAAHRTLPFGTKVRVSRGDKSVVVRINDRGPFVRSRVIDVSQAAARDLGLIGPGHGTVTLALLAE
jgi:rare lipoprotein A